MEAVVRFHLLHDSQGPAQRKVLENVPGMDSILPSPPVLGCKRPRHGSDDVQGSGKEMSSAGESGACSRVYLVVSVNEIPERKHSTFVLYV